MAVGFSWSPIPGGVERRIDAIPSTRPAGWKREARTVPGAERISPVALAGILALAFLLVAVLLGIWSASPAPAPASLAVTAVWSEREPALRARLRAVRSDDRAGCGWSAS